MMMMMMINVNAHCWLSCFVHHRRHCLQFDLLSSTTSKQTTWSSGY